jgi:type VI protein secretion system component VasK
MTGQTVTLADGWDGDASGALAAGGVFLLLIVIVWQIAATWRARMLAAREEKYRELGQKYAQLLEDSLAVQQSAAEELGRTREAVTSMERMMREID